VDEATASDDPSGSAAESAVEALASDPEPAQAEEVGGPEDQEPDIAGADPLEPSEPKRRGWWSKAGSAG
jgi:hypothetical protein